MENTTKTYTITIAPNGDGGVSMSRVNDGFNPMELLGVLDFASREIMDQISGKIKPTIVNRTVINDNQATSKTLIVEWMGKLDVSGRLTNVLTQAHTKVGIVYVEDMTEKAFLRIPHAGAKSWQEFKYLRGY